MSNSVVSSFGTLTEEQIKKLKQTMREMSDVFSMQEAQRETLKEILDSANEELKIPKKIIRKMAKTYHKRNYDEVIAEQEEFELLYEGVIKKSE